MPTFPVKGKPDVNLLEEFFKPKSATTQGSKISKSMAASLCPTKEKD